MGGNVSKDMSTTDISTEFVTDVVTTAMSTKTTSVSSDQKMKVGCTDEVFQKVVDACSKATADQAELLKAATTAAITSGKEIPDSVSKLLSTKPPVCYGCTADNVNQASTISISMSDIQDNSLAGKIQTDLLSKLDAAKTTLQNEGFSKNDVLDSSMTTISNKIKSSITTKVINDTLSTFTNTQDLTIGNTMGANNINQTSVINYVSSALVQNVVEGDSTVKAAIDNITKKDTTQKSIASNTTDMVGSVANNLIDTVGDVAQKGLGVFGNLASTWIIMIVVGFIAFIFLATKFLGSSGGQQFMQQMGQPMGQSPGYPQQPPAGFQMNFNPAQARNLGNNLLAAASMGPQGRRLQGMAKNIISMNRGMKAFV